MSRLFISSDYHLGHSNIIIYTNRPFKSLEHMNGEIVRRHNERVKPDDQFIHNGDFCFKNSKGGKEGEGAINKADYYKGLLNGEKVFTKGNHDSNNSLKTRIHNLVINFNGEDIFVTHKPEHCSFNHKLNLCGHVHNLWKHKQVEQNGKKTWIINVGCDVWNYYPISIDEIFEYYHKLKSGKIV